MGVAPGMPGAEHNVGLIAIEPQRVQRIGRLLRKWPVDHADP